jgi:hypothetical protein
MIVLDDVLKWFPGVNTVRIVVDGDPSNREAADVVVSLCRNAGVTVSIEGLPPGIDPRALTADEIAALVHTAVPSVH